MNQNNILEKLGIETLNPMQKEALEVLTSHNEVVLLSPTGTGKTVAFLLPLIESLSTTCNEIQTLIIVPSRELALQLEQVIRQMGSGFKTNAVYGGRAGAQDKIELVEMASRRIVGGSRRAPSTARRAGAQDRLRQAQSLLTMSG